MQRLFSTFPNGWPGAGLLVLRIASGGYLAAISESLYISERLWHVGPLPLTAAISGGLLLIGLWTPVAGVLAALLEILMIFKASEGPKAGMLLVCISTAIAMLGPGCWSIDSILFGRRRLNISDQ